MWWRSTSWAHRARARRRCSRRPPRRSTDLATDRDAARLQEAGIPSLSITTGSACHLDARLVHEKLHELPWHEARWLFIENVGNLVCPAIYDLGQEANVVALSVTEGEDKPLKYPVMFHKADLVVLTKVDLLPHLPGVEVEAIGCAGSKSGGRRQRQSRRRGRPWPAARPPEETTRIEADPPWNRSSTYC